MYSYDGKAEIIIIKVENSLIFYIFCLIFA